MYGKILCVLLLYSICLQPIEAEKTRVLHLEPGSSIIHDPGLYSLKPVLCIYCYNGAQKSLYRLFETVELQLDIDGVDYQQYEGTNPKEVLDHYEEHRSLFSFTLFSQKRTRLPLSPFQPKCFGIETSQSYVIRLLQLRIDFWRVIEVLVACLIFFKAAHLSHNTFFYYITGILLGITFSFVLLIFLCGKLLPRRSMMYGAIVGGWAVGVYIIRLLWENLQTIVLTYRNFIIWYILITGLLSFFFCYRMGPPQNKRSRQIVKWVLQLISQVLIYAACSFEEVAVIFMCILLVVHFFPSTLLSGVRQWYRRKYPPKRRLLTNEEYYEQTVRETRKALDELRVFASSPECPQWKVMQRLRNPMRFAEFVEGASHLSDAEVLDFENSEELLNDEEDKFEESEEEIGDSRSSNVSHVEYSSQHLLQYPRPRNQLTFYTSNEE